MKLLSLPHADPLEEAEKAAGPSGKQYKAPAFNAPDVERGMLTKRKQPLGEEPREFIRYRRLVKVNWFGLLAFLIYLGALGFYLWIRITKTLDLGPYLWYGCVILGIEMLGATTVILYGLNLVLDPIVENYHLGEDPTNPGKPRTRYPYHVRVLVPCYKESLEILRRTVMAAYDATLPAGCSRTIYLCDDGKDPKKRKWVDSLGSDVVYVSGRKRPPGEMNGKSGNINNVCSQLYPPGTVVPGNELVCIFDADQVASKDFFQKTLPLFDGGDDIGMVLSPQCFHNLNLHTDIFNHSNVHFWEYMQPGYDALGFISCTGTNFLVRSNALLEVGGSPTWTLTEDYALGMQLKKFGWHCRYVQEYLAIGEAPDQIRNCYQQRSRWCKGHFQIMFNWMHCPLFQSKLSWPMRIMYSSGVWSYIVGAISTPTFIIIPAVTIWFGVFPIVVSRWTALGVTVYYFATNMVLYYVRSWYHVEALWFANVANQLMWWTYVKALWRAVNSICGSTIKFKTTLKGASMLMNSALRDLWMPGFCFFLMLASIITGFVKLAQGPTLASPLIISILWAFVAAVPPFLALYYATIARGPSLAWLCRIALILSFLAGIAAVLLMWVLYPVHYDYATALKETNSFFNAQRVGALPPDNNVPWRSNALLYETGKSLPVLSMSCYSPNGNDLTGGWLNGGPAGNLKMTMPTAFTVSLMSWGLLSFPSGYAQANATSDTMSSIKWGADYLLKCMAYGPEGNITGLVYQVGNLTTDSLFWGRPEDITMKRPYYLADPDMMSDLGGATVGALASAAMVWRTADYGYYQRLMAAAAQLYDASLKTLGKYSQNAVVLPCEAQYAKSLQGSNVVPVCVPASVQLNGSAIPLYNSSSIYDKLLWAATWMYKATGDTDYLGDAESFYIRHIYDEGAPDTVLYTWDDYYWASNVLLAETTDGGTFHERTQYFLQQWVCGFDKLVQYTGLGRAWNTNDGTLATTANAVFLATRYAKYVLPSNTKKATKYFCWARAQTRYVLGDAGRSLLTGYGKDPPTHVQNEAASCPPAPIACNAVSAQLSPDPNPNTLYGALVEGPIFSDTFQDVRNLNQTRVMLEYNAGFQGAAAGLLESPGTWEVCLQGYSVLVKDKTVCG
ncbi:g10450 [Coccomyxa elongata]